MASALSAYGSFRFTATPLNLAKKLVSCALVARKVPEGPKRMSMRVPGASPRASLISTGTVICPLLLIVVVISFTIQVKRIK